MNTLSLRDAIDLIRPNAEEAVAIAQQLLRASLHSDVHPPPKSRRWTRCSSRRMGPPSVRRDPRLPTLPVSARCCRPCCPRAGGPRVSGSLRYTIARAIGATPAPPFPSRAALAAALARHQPGDPSALVRALHARATAAAPAVAGNDVERRRIDRAAAELRRHLRRADEERYLLAHRAPSTAMVTILPAPPVLPALPTPRRPTRASAAAICGAAAAILIAFGAGYTTMARLSRTPEHMPARPPCRRPSVR